MMARRLAGLATPHAVTCRKRSVLVMIPRNRPESSKTTALPPLGLSAISFLMACIGVEGRTFVT